MPNVPRRPRADPDKYKGKTYLTYEEAMDYLGIRRSTLYSYITELNLQPQKFPHDRRRYLAFADVERLDQVMEQPWLFAASEKGEPSQGGDVSPEAGEGESEDE